MNRKNNNIDIENLTYGTLPYGSSEYGGLQVHPCPLPGDPGSSSNPKTIGSTLTMSATPIQGVAPYSLQFRETPSNSMDGSDAGATYIIPTVSLAIPPAPYSDPVGMTTGANSYGNIPEGGTVTRIYTLTTTDINGATTKSGDPGPSITFASTVTDSCNPPQICTNVCKIYVTCPAPVCDFTVT